MMISNLKDTPHQDDAGSAVLPNNANTEEQLVTVDLEDTDHRNAGSANEDLPTNVNSKEQLEDVPPFLLSDNPKRPLLSTDDDGTKYTYNMNPLFYSVVFILLIELLERFSFYGLNFSQTSYLTGQYNEDWNAGMTPVEASSFVSASTAVAYTAPFLGGILADGFLGDYLEILLGTSLLYIPGLLLIALTAFPGLLGATFNRGALVAGMLVLWPLGAGTIKSVVNVFGAKQYHPVLQASMIESYYVNFYMAINIGALAGGILIPLLAEVNVSVAYMIPVCALVLGVICFVLGSRRYVRVKPKKDALFNTLKIVGSAIVCKPPGKSKKSNGGAIEDGFVDGVKQLFAVIPVSALIVPFSIAYSQMTTVFIIQGTVMKQAGLIDASLMNNVDAISVLIFGFIVGRYLYPFLSKRGITLSISHKFAIGTFLGGLAILSAILVDYSIHSAYNSGDGRQISILWQAFSYLFIGAGEIFAIASAYDAAFTIAPKEQKGFASAINLFFIGSIPNFIDIGLYNGVKEWFPSGDDSSSIEAYSESQVYNYLWILFGISMFGVILNVLPPVKNWVERTHKAASKNALRGSIVMEVQDVESQKMNEDDSVSTDMSH